MYEEILILPVSVFFITVTVHPVADVCSVPYNRYRFTPGHPELILGLPGTHLVEWSCITGL